MSLSVRPLLTLLLLSLASPLLAADWPPVAPEDLASTRPTVEPDAEAEAIFYDLRIEDQYEAGRFRNVQDHHVRLKLYTAGAVERFGNVKLELEDSRLLRVEGRTLLPDGRVVPLDPSTVARRVIEREGGRRVNGRAFAMPAMEPGCIIEYRFRITRPDAGANYARIPLQYGYPMRRFDLRLKPISAPDVTMHHRTFHTTPVTFEREGSGDYRARFTSVRALREEPFMPPADAVRSWMLVYYIVGKPERPERFWRDFARREHEEFLRDTKPGKATQALVTALLDGVTDPEDRLARLHARAQASVRILGAWDDTSSTDEERDALDSNRPVDAVIASGQATAWDAARVFAAMTRAAGLDTRLLRVATRRDPRFDMGFTDDYFLDSWDIAVRMPDGWRIVDPSSTRLACGMLPWTEEGVTGLLADPDSIQFIETPIADPWTSVRRATADLQLTPEGAVEGDVRLTYTGHEAWAARGADASQGHDERVKHWTGVLEGMTGELDATDLSIDRGENAERPMVVRARVRAPEYATATGTRMFVIPAFFRAGVTPLFTADIRRTPVQFPYPWAQVDSVRLRVPEGYRIEPPPPTSPVTVPGIGEMRTQVEVAADGRSLLHVRTFHFGEGGSIAFPAESYAALRKVFDTIHERDHRTLVVRAAGEP